MDHHLKNDTIPFKTIVIVGVGLIGGSLGQAIRRKHSNARIIGVSSPGAITSAIDIGAVTEGCGYDELSNVAKEADLIFLCTPIHRIQGLLTVLATSLKAGVTITDVGSTKSEITAHAEEVLSPDVHFIGGHPMAGAEVSGVQASDPFLFQNAMYVLTPASGVPDSLIEKFSAFLIDALGARVAVIDATLHDRIAATVSHLPQIIAVTLINMVAGLDADNGQYMKLAAGGFRDMTRIASSPFSMWDDVCRTNQHAISEAVDLFIDRLRQIQRRVGSTSLSGDFEVANIRRAAIPRTAKGFIRTLSEIMVVVEDMPGVIADIATACSERDLNIKDIEVVKVREGEGGTLRLAFEREDEALDAVEHLTERGYTARMRR